MNSAIVVVVDRLGAGYLGPYGNTWIDTAELNRLASQSLLFEFATIDSPRLDLVYRSYWQGLHAMQAEAGPEQRSLAGILTAEGVRASLLTDDPQVADHPLARDFTERITLAPSIAERAADELAQTQLAQLFATAIDWLEQAAPPFLLWIHAQAIKGPWDAPPTFRNRFADEDDPLPPDFVAPPQQKLDEDYDPDDLLGVMHAYAGQVVAMDACIGALLDALADPSSRCGPLAERTLLVFTSPRGFPLGEHRRVGPCDHALFGELLHVPWLMRFPSQWGAMLRSQALVQPPDLCATLLEWRNLSLDPLCQATPGGDVLDNGGATAWRSAEPRPDQAPLVPPAGNRGGPALWGRSLLPILSGEQLPLCERACAIAGGQRAIRTPAWFLRSQHSHAPALYVKPDDRWEVNEVSDLCEEVVAELLETLDEFQQAAQSGGIADLSPLPEILSEGLE